MGKLNELSELLLSASNRWRTALCAMLIVIVATTLGSCSAASRNVSDKSISVVEHPPFVEGSYPALGALPAKKAPKTALVDMGKRLFFDARISGDGGITCADCHDPEQGFADGKPLSKAYPGTRYFRNAPSLINVRYKEDFANVGWAWTGQLGANLNDVMRDQITETYIMNMDMRIMHERMKQDPVYVKMCAENFGKDCSSGHARKALVAFVESLVSNGTSLFDSGQLAADARRGQAIFEGKAQCIQCHNGPYFSDGKPHNTSVPENLEIFKDPMRHLTFRAVIMSTGVPNATNWRRDPGYFSVSRNYKDVGKFITPTLRELTYTAPYMHNGTIATLTDVVDFYNEGSSDDDPFAPKMEPLGLSDSEKVDLVAFLESLSSKTPVTVAEVEVSQEYEPIENWLEVKN